MTTKKLVHLVEKYADGDTAAQLAKDILTIVIDELENVDAKVNPDGEYLEELVDWYGIEAEIEKTEFKPRSPVPACNVCGHQMTHVRPGKYQCDYCDKVRSNR